MAVSKQPISLSASVLRPRDLLALRFDFVNLTPRRGRVPEEPPWLVRIDPAAPAYLVVHFPPQHLAEQSVFEKKQPLDSRNLPGVVQSVLADSSKLVFRIPDGVASIPYTLDALLDWRSLDLIGDDRDGEFPETTSIEIPYRMILSLDQPGAGGGGEPVSWAHVTTPATNDGWTELCIPALARNGSRWTRVAALSSTKPARSRPSFPPGRGRGMAPARCSR